MTVRLRLAQGVALDEELRRRRRNPLLGEVSAVGGHGHAEPWPDVAHALAILAATAQRDPHAERRGRDAH